MNLAELAERALQRLGERLALDFEGERITNAEIMAGGRRIQSGLEELGFGRGKIAVLFTINHPAVYPIFQGIFRSGGTGVPVMFQLTPAELRYILCDTRAEVVFTDTTVLYKVREAIKDLDFIKWLVIRGGKDNPEASPKEISLESLLARDPRLQLPQIDEDDIAIMLYTSGTTGKPKGVMLSHGNLIASAEAANEAAELDRWEGPRVGMSAMPMAHIFGVGVMNSGYLIPERLADAYTVQMQWFQPETFMRKIQEHKCTTMASVPTMLSLILTHPKSPEYDLSSIVEVICGAAPLPVEVAKAFMDRYKCRVREIYGMTENAGIGSANRMSLPYRPGSAGRKYFNTEVRVVDENDNPLPPGKRGEIVTRGPSTMKGYFNRPKETEETLRGGWLHSGDIGYFDEEGWL
ncbi:AMP-binding protein, partial [Candidatus Sumerlaeota bacterium]|nr:AMP-binding protein [Candidatus Sumerlaeota bacterium]